MQSGRRSSRPPGGGCANFPSQMKTSSTLQTHFGSTDAPDWAWRILKLVNAFRLLVPLVLLAIFFILAKHSIGQLRPELFVAVASGYLLFAIGSASSLRRRWPRIDIQAVVQICAD